MRGEKENQEASAVITPSTPTETSEQAPSPTKFAPAIETRAKKNIPWRMRRVFSLQDLDRPATRFLPAPIFGYVSGVAETGLTHKANRQQFDDYRFVPRTLMGHLVRDQSTTLFGKRYDRPFGIAPMGFSALAAYDGDVVLARAAGERGTLAVMSATSLTPLERVAEEGNSRWFQAYFPGETERVNAMVDRIAAAGYETLVVTVDIPVNGNREIDLHNGFVTPLKPTLRLAWQGATRPGWLFGTAFRTLATRGMPHFENLDVDQGPAIIARNVVRSFRKREALAWEHVKAARERWKGKFVIKGILSAEDAAAARDMGCDGVIVSNHGGRQLDSTLHPLAALKAVKAEAGDMAVMIDSGFRRGTEVLKAIALGADFVFIGRPFLYAAALVGEAGVRHAIDILSSEIDRNMALLGAQELSEITSELLACRSGGRVDRA